MVPIARPRRVRDDRAHAERRAERLPERTAEDVTTCDELFSVSAQRFEHESSPGKKVVLAPRYRGVMRATQRKGDIATARAVATFTEMGFDVAIPLTESAAYDLVVDDVIKECLAGRRAVNLSDADRLRGIEAPGSRELPGRTALTGR
jgi:PD-(D/E)XK endonuclease